MKNVVAVIGPGSTGLAITRCVRVGKNVLRADLKLKNAQAPAQTPEQ